MQKQFILSSATADTDTATAAGVAATATTTALVTTATATKTTGREAEALNGARIPAKNITKMSNTHLTNIAERSVK